MHILLTVLRIQFWILARAFRADCDASMLAFRDPDAFEHWDYIARAVPFFSSECGQSI